MAGKQKNNKGSSSEELKKGKAKRLASLRKRLEVTSNPAKIQKIKNQIAKIEGRGETVRDKRCDNHAPSAAQIRAEKVAAQLALEKKRADDLKAWLERENGTDFLQKARKAKEERELRELMTEEAA